ncbi:hypothetical protein Tco_0552533, partial [Tanacetum coccineum]
FTDSLQLCSLLLSLSRLLFFGGSLVVVSVLAFFLLPFVFGGIVPKAIA